MPHLLIKSSITVANISCFFYHANVKIDFPPIIFIIGFVFLGLSSMFLPFLPMTILAFPCYQTIK